MLPQSIALPQSGEVHIWRLDLDKEKARPELLSSDEKARVRRFRFEQDARRWAVCRSLLRVTLGRYLDVVPETLRFDLGLWGKPGLRDCPLRFNVTHSGGAALLAFSWKCEVGVDLERLEGDAALEASAQVFSLPERAWLRGHTLEDYHAAFLTLWTAKEAYVKATGMGLSFPLTRLTLLPAAGTAEFHASQLVSLCPISLRRLDAGPDALAALALEGVLDSVRYFDFDDAD